MNLVRSLGSVGGLTLVSRILALVRDTLQASYVGAGFASDAFFVSFRLPNMFRALFAEGAFSAAFGMIILNGLPQPYHPVFNVPSFVRASQDRFFLAIEASDPKFNPSATKEFLVGLRAREVNNIDH